MNNNDNILSGNDVSTVQVNSQVDFIDSMIVEKSKSYRDTRENHTQEYTDYVEHPYVLALPNWTVANPLGFRQLITNDIFNAYYDNVLTSPLGNKLKNFFYFDGVMRVTYVVQGSSFASGKLVICFDPDPTMDGQPATEVLPPDLVRCFQIPHLVIDPSKTATYTIDLPCPTIYGVWCRKIGVSTISAGSYQAYTIVVNPLLSGTATVPTIQMVGYYQLVSPKLEGLTYTLTSLKVEKSVKLSDAFLKASEVSKTLSSYVPSFSGEINLFSNVSDSVGKALAWFGFSKGEVKEISRFIPSNSNNYGPLDGRVLTQPLTLRNNNSLGLGEGECPLLSQEDQTVSCLCARPGLVDITGVPFSSSTGTLLKTLYVTPMMTYDMGRVDLAQEITPLAFCAYPYRFWTGSIDIDIDVVASVFHRATLVVIYEPYHVQNNDALALKMQANKHWTIYVSGNSSTRITIPWRQPTPWKYVTDPMLYSTITSLETFQNCNGYIRLYLLNTVTTNGSTDPFYVNFFYSSTDIKFAQVADTGKQVSLVLTSGVFSRSMGEEHAHTIKELASRATCFLDIFPNASLIAGGYHLYLKMCNSMSMLLDIGNSNGLTLDYLPPNLHDFLSSAYVGNRGSIRYTIVPPREPLQVGLISVNDSSDASSVNHGFATSLCPDLVNFSSLAMTNGSLEPIFTFTSPQYANALYRPFEMHTVEPDCNYFEVVVPFRTISTVNADHAHFQFLRAAGDDFQFVGFRGVPMSLYI